jgi:hypothetical protein
MTTLVLTPKAAADVRELAQGLGTTEAEAISRAVAFALRVRELTLGFGGLGAGQGRPAA